jgi:hypothetical protein
VVTPPVVDSVPVPITVTPAEKVTVPVGVPLRLAPVTVAVSVVGLPATTVVGEATRLVVEFTVVTVAATVTGVAVKSTPPVGVPEPLTVRVAGPELCSTGVTVTFTVAVPPEVRVADPPLQLASVVTEDAHVTVAVPT